MTATQTDPRPHADVAMPAVVSQAEWQVARDQLLLHEK
ncbi:MAG: hypothetical protein JWN72_1962, partial [Thermoleophilia bacterium]|nr:hypothetical protein [Thermoleophilia bacterium]